MPNHDPWPYDEEGEEQRQLNEPGEANWLWLFVFVSLIVIALFLMVVSVDVLGGVLHADHP